MNYIDTKTFKKMFVLASQKLEQHIEELNQINVFPVADGDTGNNLYHTLKAVETYIYTTSETITLAEVAQGIARTALVESRGNSGTVISQIIWGLCEHVTTETISISLLAQAFIQSNIRAKESFEKPRKGTILDITGDLALCLEEASNLSEETVPSFMGKIYQVACTSLEHTRGKLAESQQANVVDAGAAGYVYILQGFYEAVSSETYTEIDLKISQMHMVEAQELTYQYCTEIVVKTSTLVQLSSIQSQFEQYGDSLQTHLQPPRLKIHIHTNDPNQVQKIAEQYGEIISFKADDMEQMQQENVRKLSHILGDKKGKGLAIVIDTVADLPQQLYEKNDIYTLPIPLYVMRNAQEISIDTSSADSFYTEMEQNPQFIPKTSKISTGAYLELFQKLTEEYQQVVYLSVSSGISGSFQSAVLAHQRLSQLSAQKLTVFDTKSGSAGISYYVNQFASAFSENKSMQELAATLSNLPRPSIYFMVENTVYLTRSGRLTGIKSFMATSLNIQPVLHLDSSGKIEPTSQKTLFGNPQKNLHFMVQKVLDEVEKNGARTIFIVYTDQKSTQHVQTLQTLFSQSLRANSVTVQTLPLTLVVGAHTGPGTVGVICY